MGTVPYFFRFSVVTAGRFFFVATKKVSMLLGCTQNLVVFFFFGNVSFWWSDGRKGKVCADYCLYCCSKSRNSYLNLTEIGSKSR